MDHERRRPSAVARRSPRERDGIWNGTALLEVVAARRAQPRAVETARGGAADAPQRGPAPARARAARLVDGVERSGASPPTPRAGAVPHGGRRALPRHRVAARTARMRARSARLPRRGRARSSAASRSSSLRRKAEPRRSCAPAAAGRGVGASVGRRIASDGRCASASLGIGASTQIRNARTARCAVERRGGSRRSRRRRVRAASGRAPTSRRSGSVAAPKIREARSGRHVVGGATGWRNRPAAQPPDAQRDVRRRRRAAAASRARLAAADGERLGRRATARRGTRRRPLGAGGAPRDVPDGRRRTDRRRAVASRGRTPGLTIGARAGLRPPGAPPPRGGRLRRSPRRSRAERRRAAARADRGEVAAVLPRMSIVNATSVEAYRSFRASAARGDRGAARAHVLARNSRRHEAIGEDSARNSSEARADARAVAGATTSRGSP